VRFPGVPDGEAWPPARFEFDAAWMREPGLAFERDAAGGIGVVRAFGHLRLVVDIESAHQIFDIEPGTRDFRLLRLIAPALRCVDRIEPGDRRGGRHGALRGHAPRPAGPLDVRAGGGALHHA
jgi:hypothetical protein